MFNKEVYIERREKLKKSVGSGILLFLGNDDMGRNYEDNAFGYRQDSSFLYFFGQAYAGLSAIIDIDENKEIIFGDELSIDYIVWMGTQPTLHEKCENAGISITMPAAEVVNYLQKALSKGQKIHYLPPYRAEHRLKLFYWLGIHPQKQDEGVSVDFMKAIINQRNYKSAIEIEEIEKACVVTADMHIEAIKYMQPGMRESDVAAVIERVASAAGYGLSFPTIATINGQTLHNHYHGNVIKEGDLFLIDAGAETPMGYAGDMSSTVCVGKKFTRKQKEIYDVQNEMYTETVKALRPGVTFESVHDIAATVLVDRFKELGLMKGDTETAVREGAHAMFFPHGLGHMMGLDVHDMENFGEELVGYDGKPKSKQFGRKSLRLARTLEPGFVHTIEPGIYFIPELIDLWRGQNKFTDFINYDKVEEYKDFGGIRNEQDYLITETGSRLLGKKKPLTTEEVEAMR